MKYDDVMRAADLIDLHKDLQSAHRRLADTKCPEVDVSIAMPSTNKFCQPVVIKVTVTIDSLIALLIANERVVEQALSEMDVVGMTSVMAGTAPSASSA